MYMYNDEQDKTIILALFVLLTKLANNKLLKNMHIFCYFILEV